MRMNTTKFKHVMAASLLTIGMPSFAQMQKSVEQYTMSTYDVVEAKFTLTEVAEALSTDTTTLRAALDLWADSLGTEHAEPNMFFLQDATDAAVRYDTYTQGGAGGFWVNSEGKPVEYGETCKWYNMLGWDGAEDAFSIYLGQMPNALTKDTLIAPKFILKFKDKEATFDISYKVTKTPDAPAPTTVVPAELNIVGTATAWAKRLDNQGYEATVMKIDAKDIREKLGIPQELMLAYIPQLVYTDSLEAATGLINTDSVSNTYTAGAPGWWMQCALYPQGHEQQGEKSPNLGATPYGSSCNIFLEAFAYNAETDSITCNMGQYPGNNAAGDSVSANVYIIYGDKAYKMNYQVVFEAAPALGLSDMTQAGSNKQSFTCYDDDADYQPYTLTIDMEAVKTALGAESLDAIGMTVKKSDDELYVGNGTANKGGFWIDEAGFASTWASGALFFEPVTADDYSTMNIGLHPQVKANSGETYSVSIYFTYGEKYYNVDVDMTIGTKEKADQSTWETVETKPAVIQVITSADTYFTEGAQTVYTLTAEQMNTALGTTSAVMYCTVHDTITAQKGILYAPYTQYLCDPAPGVWLNKDGWGQAWSGKEDVPVGICYDTTTGEFDIYQVPGINAVGSTFKAPIYFVNETTGKMIKIDFTIQFVDELVSAEIVGTENIMMPVTLNDFTADFDLAKAAEALGTTAEELYNTPCLMGLQSNGLYSTGTALSNGVNLGTDGFATDMGDINISIAKEETSATGYQFIAYSNTEVAEDYKATTSICFEINGKRYVYNITMLSENGYITGIDKVEAEVNNAKAAIYDLSGRAISAPTQKGIYIVNGKKVVIK